MEPGEMLDGRYRLIDPLGEGGFGVVWKAFDEHLRRHVAVKVLTRTEQPGHEKAEVRFWQEAITAGGLSHPHIVTVHEFGRTQHNGSRQDFLVMELLGGRSLSQILTTGPLPTQQALRWARQICAALQAAHTAGVIHRDIKPQNVMVDESTGTLKVVDFGIAKSAAFSLNLTMTGEVIGTVNYMAPERAGNGPVDARSDLYSLGCVLYELLTGNPPFTEPDAAPLIVLYRHLHQPPPAPRATHPELPEEADRLVLDLLAKDPGRRPADAATVCTRLAALASQVERPLTVLTSGAPGADPQAILLHRLQEAVHIGEKGRADTARNLLRGVVSDHVRTLGAESPQTLEARLQLAHFTSEAGGYEQAAKLMARCTLALGPEHPLTLRARIQHAESTDDALRPDLARDLFPPLIADCAAVLGPDATETLEARLHYAEALHSAGASAEARDLSAILISHCARVLGADHPLTLSARMQHALSTDGAGEDGRAKELFSSLVTDCVAARGQDARITLEIHACVSVYNSAADPSSALDTVGLLLSDCLRVLGPVAPITLVTRLGQAVAIARLASPQEGVTRLTALTADCAAAHGPDSALSLLFRKFTADFHGSFGYSAQAHGLLKPLAADCARVLGPDASFTAEVQASLKEWSQAPPRRGLLDWLKGL
ncbi:serine/threonine-protein kinase [Streptomyces triculaminicus]|uniref:serine/threonine-protein kinase n=1 Tax=Streptomyces triculaminicus TaxID=2816232 RepID=UPI0037D975DD